jgi:prefoldin subunit 5
MKTKGIYGNTLNITQTAHGTQNGKALDSNSPLIAMEDVYVYDYHHIVQWHEKAGRNTEQQSYFYVRMANSNDYFIVVHAFPLKLGVVKAGEEIGKMHWYWNWTTGQRADHFHTCANIAGTGWVEPPCVLDRSIVTLKWAYGGDNWSAHYENYRDLSINSNTVNEMVNCFPIKCKVLFDETLVRPEPNRNKDPLRKMTSGTIVEVTAYAAGENVNGSNVWCFIGDGYVHKSLVIPDQSQDAEIIRLNKELSDANNKIASQDTTIKELQIELQKCAQKEAEYASKIDDLEKDVLRLNSEIISLNKAINDLTGTLIDTQKQLEDCQKNCDGDCENLWDAIIEFLKKIFGWIKPGKS